MGSRAVPSPRRLISALVLLLIVPGAVQALPQFANPVFSVGSNPVAILSADLNGDGRPDLITVNNSSGDLSILLALEGGEFAPGVRVTVESYPVAAAVGDLNGDGRPDLVSCSANDPSSVTVLLGRGDGSFQPPAFIPALGDCSDIVMADFNGDHKADVAMLGRYRYFVTVLLGRGDGTFAPGLGAGIVNPVGTAMVVGDFNRDGNPDLAVGRREEDFPERTAGTVTVFLGNGDGSFSQGGSVSIQSGVMDLVTADFNRDNKPDLATSNAYGNLSILLGQGNGTFLVSFSGSVAPFQGAGALLAGEFNSDSRPDLAVLSRYSDAVLNRSSDSVFVLPGRGDGTFGPALRSITGGGPTALVSGDFDGDGGIDIATANYSGSSVAALAGHGDGTFGPTLRAPVGRCPGSLAAGDLNLDGMPDLVAGNYCSNDTSILLGRGDGSFEPQTLYGVGTGPQAVVVTDFDGDGIQDLAAANEGSSDVTVRPGLGDGSFGSSSRIPLPNWPTSLVSADFNRDGRPDLAAAAPMPGGITVLLGFGNGFFATQPPVPFGGARFLAVDDFNGDGIPDLAAASWSYPAGAVLLGRGDGTFISQALPLPRYLRANHLVTGDVDGDGNADAVLTVEFPPQLLFFRGRGDGSFEAPESFPLPSTPFSVVIGDFDLDQRKDLAVAEAYANDIVILRNLGGGMFAPGERFVAGKGPSPLLALDINGDGWTDLVSADGGTYDVQVLLNGKIPGVVPNRPPVANAGPDATLECASPSGAVARLDGSGSSDPDSTPGTNDDIVSFEWFEGYGGPSQTLLGTDVTLTVTLPLGVHTITLKVTDRAGSSATDTVVITVADTTPPSLSVSVSPAILWPPNHRMTTVQASTAASDACGPASVVLESILSSEPEDSGGTGAAGGGDIQGADFGTADFLFSLRVERSGTGPGRTYTITCRATDSSGNVTRSTVTVLVPHDRGDIAPGSLRHNRGKPAVPLWDPGQLQQPAP